MQDSLIKIQSVSKSYGEYKALNEVSLDIPNGKVFGLLGPNGAGKTTLIRMLNQITFPDEGQIWFENEPLKPYHTSQIGYLPEERGLYKNMKVGEQAVYLARLKGLSKEEAVTQLKFWFDKLNIADWWNKKIQELSKGMAQKVQFIVTVLHRPKLLIFDEPFSGFDPVNANLIKDEILELKEQGTTIIFSTHRMESVEELCDEIALIHKSKLVLKGSLKDIKKQYRTNQFELGVNTSKSAELQALLDTFNAKPTELKSLDEGVECIVDIGDASHDQFLSQVLSYGNIYHFREVISSVNEIFIRQTT